MIIVVDSTNRERFSGLLDQMFRLRARVFGGRLGWQVQISEGREIDAFDALDPAYVIGLDETGHVVSCVRALQTSGPHMLSDVFSAILGGDEPLRSPVVWESTRFCVDTERLGAADTRMSASSATCELMIGSLEYAQSHGITDIVTVIDPIMNRVLKRSACAPYDYLGETVQMGKVPAMAALLDCTDARISALRNFIGVHGDVFATREQARALADANAVVSDVTESSPETAEAVSKALTRSACLTPYLREQAMNARTAEERHAVESLIRALAQAGVIEDAEQFLADCAA